MKLSDQISAVLKELGVKNPEAIQFRTNGNSPRLADQGEWTGDYQKPDKIDWSSLKGSGVLIGSGETETESYFLDIKIIKGNVASYQIEVEDN